MEAARTVAEEGEKVAAGEVGGGGGVRMGVRMAVGVTVERERESLSDFQTHYQTHRQTHRQQAPVRGCPCSPARHPRPCLPVTWSWGRPPASALSTCWVPPEAAAVG